MKRNPSDIQHGRTVRVLKNRTACGAEGGKEAWRGVAKTDRQAERETDSFTNTPNIVLQTFPTQFGKHSQHCVANISNTVWQRTPQQLDFSFTCKRVCIILGGTAIPRRCVERTEQAPFPAPSSKNQFNM